MAQTSREARFMPVLALLSLGTLGLAAWWLVQATGGSAGGTAAAETLVYTQAANLQAGRAVTGDAGAFIALERTAAALNSIRTPGLSATQREVLGQVRQHVEEVLESRGDAEAYAGAVARVEELRARFDETLATIQDDASLRQQLAVQAQLERLRLLAHTANALAADLPTGGVAVERRLLETDGQLQQLVRAMQAGDRGLGLTALAQAGLEPALASLARRAEQFNGAVADALRFSNQALPGREAAGQLDALLASFETASGELTPAAFISGQSAGQSRIVILLGLAALLVMLMLLLWLRASGQRAEAAILAARSERDQQAILRLLDELGSLADGDLTVQATVSEDITGAIADSINYAVEALRDLVVTINQGAILVEDATKQTEASAKALAAASDAQSRQVQHASDAIHQMVVSIDEVSGNAERSADVARHSVDIAHKGGDAVRRTIEGMNTIRETIQETSKRIKRLGESSQEIGDIVELINDIADQTNILALNASIQASMAGEAGRGFAVVADEVQRLAERSANATKQIEVLVSTIQADTNQAVVSMERSTTDVVGGALLAENAGAALEEIEQVSNQIAMLVQNISGSAREQAEAARKVLAIAEKLKDISRDTGTSAATTTGFVSKLAGLATQLRQSVAGFALPADAIPAKTESSTAAAATTTLRQARSDMASTGTRKPAVRVVNEHMA